MSETLQDFLNSPLAIGKQIVQKRLSLAPMVGLTHVAFREVLESFGGYGLTWTEMCSAKSVPQENRYKSGIFRWRDMESSNLVCQIMGSTPEEMATAASRIEGEGLFGVDLNMGCSISTICKKGAGAALLKDPRQAQEIVQAVRSRVNCPVFVKFRTGWENDPKFAADMAKRFQDQGADCLVFHPRIAPDRRSRPPRWEHIARVKKAVDIPVFGNGNIATVQDAVRMLNETGCDGLALGRIAVARPWLFSELSQEFSPDQGIYSRTAISMAESIWNWFEYPKSFKLYKKFMNYFAANFTTGHRLRSKICNADSLHGIIQNINTHLEPCPSLCSRPNALMFAG